MSALDDLRSAVDEWVAGLIDGHSPRKVRESKVVRDPVNGFEVFDAFEVSIIDSPVVQRLRRIHQTALAYYVYPGADHTRFAHCLGVAHLAGRMFDVLRQRDAPGEDLDRREVRLAGLLHDVGHGFFSHLSESIFSEQFEAEISAIGRVDSKFSGKGFGEILSYLIVTSVAFRGFIQKAIELNDGGEIDVDRVAHYFLGVAPDGEPEKQFIAEIISSQLDADKMDYFARDCHYTGIRAEIDVERLLISLDVDHRSKSDFRHIVIRQSGVHHLEHIIFSKMMLYSSVYHQHKIRALECSVRSIFDKIWTRGDIKDERLRFSSPASILSMTEDEFWFRAAAEPQLASVVDGILNRREVPMRALALSMSTIEDQDEKKDALRKYWDMANFPATQRRIAKTIANSLSGGVPPLFGVWFDLPSTPPVSRDAKKALVDVGNDYIPLWKFFPSDEWVDAYTDNKLVAHVFTDPSTEHRFEVAGVAREYFEKEIDVRLSDRAVTRCFKPGEIDLTPLLRNGV